MKKYFIALLSLFLVSTSALIGCKQRKSNLVPTTNVTMKDVLTFNNIEQIKTSEIGDFIAQVRNDDSSWYNGAIEKSVIVSPYYSYGDGTDYIYAALVTDALHSFSFVKYSGSEIKLFVYCDQNIDFAQCLSADECVSFYRWGGNVLEIHFSNIGNATFIINDNRDKALTFFVEQETQFNPDEYQDKTIIEYQPGDYEQTISMEENHVYYFRKGFYRISNFIFASNVDVIFEDGTYIEAINPSLEKEEAMFNPDWANQIRYKAFMHGEYHWNEDHSQYVRLNNVNISGHAIIDFAKLDWHARSGLCFTLCDNLHIKDIMFVNPTEWTLYLSGADHTIIEYTKIFGYRQNSDGFCVGDSENVTVKNCFARSGDDLFEVKSLYPVEQFNGNTIQNITFDKNVGWADKCRGFGVIHETRRDISNVTFSNSILCSNPATWMDPLGSLVIICADEANISDINFDNFKIYNNGFYPINLSLLENSTANISNITFNNVSFENNKKLRLCASGSGEIRDITFTNVNCDNNKINNKSACFITGENKIGRLNFN